MGEESQWTTRGEGLSRSGSPEGLAEEKEATREEIGKLKGLLEKSKEAKLFLINLGLAVLQSRMAHQLQTK